MASNQQPSREIKRSDPHIRLTAQERHRREVWQQIVLPCVVFILFIIGIAAFVIVSPAANASLGASISIIILIIPLSVFMLTNLIMLAALVFGVTKMLAWLPHPSKQAHTVFARFARQTRHVCDVCVAPFVQLSGWRGAVDSLRHVFGKAISLKP